MKISVVLSLMSALVVSSQVLISAHAQRQTKSAPPKFALLVGISRYQNGLPPLDGPLNDVADMRSELVRFGFPVKNIVVLTNERATRNGVLKAMRQQLQNKARLHPNGDFLFYFSGHGSQTPDANGDEKVADPNDTDDETLVTFDATRSPKDRQHFDLLDDDIERIFTDIRRVPGFTGSITSILDCCYSGTATRGGSSLPRARDIAPDLRHYPLELAQNSSIPVKTPGGTLAAFSACMADETSAEDAFNTRSNGKTMRRVHGALTYYLLQALRGATKTTTNGQIWTQLTRMLPARYGQNPQLEGRGNWLFLGGAARQSAPAIEYTLSGRTLKISCGIEAGALAGGWVELNSPGLKTKSIPPLKIARADLGESEITVPAALRISHKGTARLLTPFFGSQPLLVGLGAGVARNHPVAEGFATSYRGSNALSVRMAKAGEKADVALCFGTRGSAFTPQGQRPIVESAEERGYFFSLGNGKMPLFGVFAPVKGDGTLEPDQELTLHETLENYAVQRKLLALANDFDPRQSLMGMLKVEAYRVKGKVSADGKDWEADTTKPRTLISTGAEAKLKINDEMQFEFENQTFRTLYVALLWLSQDGSVTPLQDLDDRQVMVLSPKGQKGARVSTGLVQIVAPTGQDHLKMFVSTKPLDLSVFGRDAVTRGAARRRAAFSPLDILPGLTGQTRAGTRMDSPGWSGWATQTLQISIEK